MTLILENLELKTVQREDCSRVLQIRKNVYDGDDYIPACFHQLIEAPNAKPFAAVLNNRFIAFTIAYIIDDEQTWVARANRVAEDLEGKGVMTWLQRKVEEIIRTTTSVQYKVSTTVGDNQYTLERIEQKKIHPVAKRKIKNFICDRLVLNNTMTQFGTVDSSVMMADSNCIGQMLDSEDSTRHLFKGDRVSVDLVPYRPMKSNLKYILRDNKTAIVSDVDDFTQTLLTFCHVIPVRDGLMYNIDVYGNINNLKIHILKCLQKEPYDSYGNIIIQLVFDNVHEYADIYSIMKDFSVTDRPIGVDELLCVESKIG